MNWVMVGGGGGGGLEFLFIYFFQAVEDEVCSEIETANDDGDTGVKCWVGRQCTVGLFSDSLP